jgi:hypothetical protein
MSEIDEDLGIKGGQGRSPGEIADLIAVLLPLLAVGAILAFTAVGCIQQLVR